MTPHHYAVLPAALCALLATTTAFAQTPPAASPPPDAAGAPAAAPPPAPAPPPGAAPAPAAEGAPAPAPAAAPADGKTRFRWGISGFYGRYFYSGQNGGFGGVDLRFGAQINNHLGIYGMPILGLGFGASASKNGASVSALALYGVGAVADYTVDNMFFFGGGPELLAGGGGSESVTTTSGKASANAGAFFSLVARAGIALGSVKPNRRKAFTASIDFHAVFMNKPTMIPMLTLGYDSF